LYFAGVAKSVTPGYVVVFPNRDKASSRMTKLVVGVILVVSAGLMLVITIGGWSKLQGLRGVNLFWGAIYVVIAFYIWTRWARGLLPIAAGFGILLLMLAVVAGTGLAGTSWFDRSHFGFAPAKSVFGSTGLPDSVLGTATALLIPVQVLLIVFTMLGFKQGWNVEMEVPKDKAEKHSADARAS
jgi:hypothetical protein